MVGTRWHDRRPAQNTMLNSLDDTTSSSLITMCVGSSRAVALVLERLN